MSGIGHLFSLYAIHAAAKSEKTAKHPALSNDPQSNYERHDPVRALSPRFRFLRHYAKKLDHSARVREKPEHDHRMFRSVPWLPRHRLRAQLARTDCWRKQRDTFSQVTYSRSPNMKRPCGHHQMEYAMPAISRALVITVAMPAVSRMESCQSCLGSNAMLHRWRQ